MTSSSETIIRATTLDIGLDLSAHDLSGHAGSPVTESTHRQEDLHHRYWQLEVALGRVRDQSNALSRAIAGLSP